MSSSRSPVFTGLVQPGLTGISTTTSIDILRDILSATNDIRNHLTGKKGQLDSPLDNVLNANKIKPKANVVVASPNGGEQDGWLSADQIRVYTEKCNRHKLKCKITREALRYLQAHLTFLGGNEEIIKEAQPIMDIISDPMEHLQSALTERRVEKIRDLLDSYMALKDRVFQFHLSLGENHKREFFRVGRWEGTLFTVQRGINYRLKQHKYTECLEYIVDAVLPDMEEEMEAICSELAMFEETFASDWLAKQKYEDMKKCYIDYVRKVFRTSSMDSTEASSSWSEPGKIRRRQNTFPKQKLVWDKMCDEIGHLIGHYKVVGGDKTVVEAAILVQKNLPRPIDQLQWLLYSNPGAIRTGMDQMMEDLGFLWASIIILEKSLYHQKHAFYFREVKQWGDCLWSGLFKLRGFIRRNYLDACLDYICTDLFSNMEKIVLGATGSPDDCPKGLIHDSKTEYVITGNVALELKTFRERSLPNFLVDEMERDTTRFVNITTIATFFSSVTATTLQFTYQPLGNETSEPLRGVVNLFWFVSLVFSVFSGVGSLLGLTWRKSSIYDSRKPPKLIHLWFDKAPMVFLIIAAVAFVIGLNLFAYLSVQPSYVSFATNIITGLHGICLIGVTTWFIYQLKRDSSWARWICEMMGWIGDLRIWKWIGDACRSTWTWIRHPRQEYKKNELHFKRNIYWALRLDSRVVRINRDMILVDFDSDWPEPYLLSRIVRFIAYPIKKCWLKLTRALSSIIRFVKRRISAVLHMGETGVVPDIESRKGENAAEDKPPAQEEVTEDPIKKAVNAYCAVLWEVFHADWLGRGIMSDIELCQDKRYTNVAAQIVDHTRRRLWGYPDLLRRLDDDVLSVLVAARDKARREFMEEMRKHNPASETHVEGADANIGDKKGKESRLEVEDAIRPDKSESGFTGGQTKKAQTTPAEVVS